MMLYGLVRPAEEEPDPEDAEAGSGTTLALGVIALLLLAMAIATAIGQLYLAQVRLQTGVDLAALAGAGHSPSALLEPPGGAGSGAACQMASRAATLNDVTVDSCEVRAGDIWVTGSRTVTLWFGATYNVGARARAGPPGL